MASEPVFVIVISGLLPIVVANDDSALIGQTIIDYATANPSSTEFSVSVRPGTRETAEV
jgi:hypothetical protein